MCQLPDWEAMFVEEEQKSPKAKGMSDLSKSWTPQKSDLKICIKLDELWGLNKSLKVGQKLFWAHARATQIRSPVDRTVVLLTRARNWLMRAKILSIIISKQRTKKIQELAKKDDLSRQLLESTVPAVHIEMTHRKSFNL